MGVHSSWAAHRRVKPSGRCRSTLRREGGRRSTPRRRATRTVSGAHASHSARFRLAQRWGRPRRTNLVPNTFMSLKYIFYLSNSQWKNHKLDGSRIKSIQGIICLRFTKSEILMNYRPTPLPLCHVGKTHSLHVNLASCIWHHCTSVVIKYVNERYPRVLQ